jgi:sulfatase maturation enzyme AslB (radical SAM superfamily)
MSAILVEFNKDKAQLDDRIIDYDLQLDSIRNQQSILRQDPTYQKAMKAHNNLVRAKRESQKINKMLNDVNSQYTQAEIDFENAKLAFEKAKARKEKLESNTDELKNRQEEALNHETNMNDIYTETIKEVLSLDEIKKYVSKGIKLCEKE